MERAPPAEATIVVLRRADGREVPLRAVPWRGGMLVAVTDADPTWLGEPLATGRVRLREGVDGPWKTRSVRELRDPSEIADGRRRLRGAVSDALWSEHFGSIHRWLSVGAAEPEPTSHEETEEIRAEFDALAPFYDGRIQAQPVQRYLRGRALAILRRAFPAPGTLVELGPGSGAQTLPMLQEGHRIIAIDVSPEMLEGLRRRAAAARLSGRLVARQGSAQSVGQILAEEKVDRIDGAYAMFGAIDLDPDPAAMARPLARATAPDGRLVLGFLQRRALVPAIELALVGHPRAALARLRSAARVEGWARTLSVRPHRLHDLATRFAPEFEVERTEPVSAFAPPFRLPRAERFFGEAGLARLATWDRRTSERGWMSWGADQLVVTLRRTRAPSTAPRNPIRERAVGAP